MLGQIIVYFCMTGDGLAHSGRLILVPIVISAAPYEGAAHFLDYLEELFSFHYTAMSSCVRTSGMSFRVFRMSLRFSFRSSRVSPCVM